MSVAEPQWMKFIANPDGIFGTSSATDSNGNVFVCGYTGANATLTMRFGDNAAYAKPSLSVSHMLVGKMNSIGEPQWLHWIEGGGDKPQIGTDSYGNVYFSGKININDNTSFLIDNINVTKPLLNSAAGYIGKYNTNGELQWLKWVDTSNINDTLTNMKVDSLGNIYIAGFTDQSITSTINVGGETFTKPVTMGSAVFAVKLNTSGVGQWARWLDSTGGDVSVAIDVDSAENLYVSGTTQYYNTFKADGVDVLPAETTLGQGSSFIAKINSSGALVWNKWIKQAGMFSVSSIASDNTGNVYIVGKYEPRGNNGENGSIIVAGTNYNTNTNPALTGFITKLNSSGQSQWLYWNHTLGKSLKTDSEGNVYIGGSGYNIPSPMRFGNNTSYNITINNAPTWSGDTGFVGMIDSSGTPKWFHAIHSTEVVSIDMNANGDISFAGRLWYTGQTGVRFGSINPYAIPSLSGNIWRIVFGKFSIPPPPPTASVTSLGSSGVITKTLTTFMSDLKAATITNGSLVNTVSLGMTIPTNATAEVKKTATKQIITTIFENKSAINSFKVKRENVAIAASNVKEEVLILKSSPLAIADIPIIVIDPELNSKTSVYTSLENVGDKQRFQYDSKVYIIAKINATKFNFTDVTAGTTKEYNEGYELIYNGLVIVF